MNKGLVARVMVALVAVLGLVLGACGDKKEPAGEAAKATPDAAVKAAQPAPAPPKAPSPSPIARADRETCEKVAKHVNDVVLTAAVPDDAPASEKKQLAALAAARRDALVTFCTETTIPAEAECMLAAKTARQLIDCGRVGRQVPADLLEATEVTAEHCELFFFRLRQFKILDGIAPAEIDKDHDQLVRKCQEQAKPGTLICFLAAPDYETARRCP